MDFHANKVPRWSETDCPFARFSAILEWPSFDSDSPLQWPFFTPSKDDHICFSFNFWNRTFVVNTKNVNCLVRCHAFNQKPPGYLLKHAKKTLAMQQTTQYKQKNK